MRREQVLKICLNHMLTPDIEYRPKDDKTWLFCAPDFSEGEIDHQKFCLRFKTGEVAQDFKKSITNALQKITDKNGKVNSMFVLSASFAFLTASILIICFRNKKP